MSGSLILTRRCNESLVIGDDITITVIGIRAGQVRLAISAPKIVPVHRHEVWLRIKAEREPV